MYENMYVDINTARHKWRHLCFDKDTNKSYKKSLCQSWLIFLEDWVLLLSKRTWSLAFELIKLMLTSANVNQANANISLTVPLKYELVDKPRLFSFKPKTAQPS